MTKEIKKQEKINVLDTSVIIYDPKIIEGNFPGETVVIPFTVLDELDKLKTSPADKGRRARVAIKKLDQCCKLGNIITGVVLENKTKIVIGSTKVNDQRLSKISSGDNEILAYTLFYKGCNFYSRDINLRIRAQALGISAFDYSKDDVSGASDIYEGSIEIEDDNLAARLHSEKEIPKGDFNFGILPNEGVFIKSEDSDTVTVAIEKKGSLQLVTPISFGIYPKNPEQVLAAHLLLDSKIPLVSLIGRSGSGKTLLSLAAAMHSVIEKKQYKKLVIYRPIHSVSTELGFLPGTKEEKLEPWMVPIMDSFEFLFSGKMGKKETKKKGAKDFDVPVDSWKIMLEEYKAHGIIEMEAISYIRGRNIPDAFILIDEAQNLTQNEIKTIITRAAQGSKIVLTGDIEQIDNEKLDAIYNGLTYVVEKFKTSSLAGHVTMKHCERSALAEEAAKIL